jgi:hypothetical protein
MVLGSLMAKTYIVSFGSGNPQASTGLRPTFLIFSAGAMAVSPPGVTETPISSGLYQFNYGPTIATAYLLDGAGSLSSVDRYIAGVLDPLQAVDQQLGFILSDTFGGTAVPTALSGYFKRFTEFMEADEIYTKATALWRVFNRGQTTLLRTKSMTDFNTTSTRTGSG